MIKFHSNIKTSLVKFQHTSRQRSHVISLLLICIFLLSKTLIFSQNEIDKNSEITYNQATISSPNPEKESALPLSPLTQIFDIKQPISISTSSVLEKADGAGTGKYATEKLVNGNLNVRFTFNKPTPPNPMFLSYNFTIQPISNGGYAMDMKAALPPFVLYNDTTQLEMTFIGDNINFIPSEITSNQLSNASGKFILKKIKTGEVFLTYDVTVLNRKFVKKENIIIDGISYEVYEHTYDFNQNTLINGCQVLSNYEQKVSELFIPNYGLVSQNRAGNQLTITSSGKHATSCNLQTTLLHLNSLTK